MLQRIREDIKAIFDRDPAVKNVWEVLLCYPGLHAVIIHRLAHWLYGRKLYTVARLLSQFSRFFTQIEIHPGAKIGRGLFIDHGCGVVIGETVEIGDNVTIYQGVTLGGTGKESGKRHPTIGNYVVISAGAKILGSIKVGDYAKVGAGSVVLREVPSQSTVVGVPGRVVRHKSALEQPQPIDLEHANLPDPENETIKCLLRRVRELEMRLDAGPLLPHHADRKNKAEGDHASK
ncbi:MAG: serine O-acetyltransferase [Bacillota bacterium]|nr:MAG: serine O-acetyltransferase [Bacillota bacterium]